MGVSLRDQIGACTSSVDAVRAAVGLPKPASVRRILEENAKPVVLEDWLDFGEGVPFEGHHAVTFSQSGAYRYQGYFNARGWPSAKISLASLVSGNNGVALVLAASRDVYGTNKKGDRSKEWLEDGVDQYVALKWLDLRSASLGSKLHWNTDWLGTIGAVGAFLAETVVAAYAGGALGLVVALGSEAADALGAQEVAAPGLVGVAVTGGTILVLGQGGTFFAYAAGVAAGIATAASIQQRALREDEWAFVKRVYGDRSLPDRENVLITNLLGLGGRPFTVPLRVPGHTIVVNLGDGFDNPTGYTGGGQGPVGVVAPGSKLIHEMCHAWQIHNSNYQPWMTWNLVVTAAKTGDGDMSVYRYGPAGEPWGSFNTEQQAQIVQEWFEGKARPRAKDNPDTTPQSRFEPMDESGANPYWQYLRDNIRPGVI